jgi:UDP-glucose 4-epimerase
VGDTTPIRDLTFVGDTVAAFIAAGSAVGIEFGSPYNAGSERAVTVADIIELVLDMTKCSKPVHRDEGRLRPVNSEVRALLADSSRFQRETGWKPATSLREGLDQTISWWRHRLEQGRVRQEKGYIT